VWFADLAAEAASSGETVLDRLARLYVRDGLWVGEPRGIIRPGTEGLHEIADAVDRLADSAPDRLGGLEVLGIEDFRHGADTRPRWLPATPLVALRLEGGSRVLVRPSGTEPKLKVYAYVRAEVVSVADVAAAAAAARLTASAIATDLISCVGLDRAGQVW
jgi:phosphomannomutase